MKKKSPVPCQDSSCFPLEELVTRISARIVRASSEELDDFITQSLKEIGAVCNVDRCGLLSVRNNILVVTHGWQNADVPQLPEGRELAYLYPWSWRRLYIDREVVAIDKVDDLPPEAQVDQQSHRQRQQLFAGRHAVDHFLEYQRHSDAGEFGAYQAGQGQQHASPVLPEIGEKRAERLPGMCLSEGFPGRGLGGGVAAHVGQASH